MRITLQTWGLRAAAAFALVWSVLRAAHQSITLDEADTYLWFGGGQSAKFIWYPFPNNHILNSLLIWISTHLFGVSVLTVRLPALLGAALYISVAYFLCGQITERSALRFAAFICLVYNPFVMDFFAAARGYSLANAFLLTALAVPVWQTRTGRWSVPASSALASAAIGLSFAANLSFAFVDMAALLAIAVWAVRRREAGSRLRIVACCLFPAFAVSAGMCGYAIAHFPRQELWYGAQSLSQMTTSLVNASLYRLYDPLGTYAVVRSLGRLLLLALAVLCAARLLLDGSRRDVRTQIAAGIGGILVLTLAAHYLAFRLAGLPMPMTRTGIFFLPLCTLLVAAIAAIPSRSVVSCWLGHAVAVAFLCLAGHFLLSLRYTYFQEYDKDADTQEVYRVLVRLNQRYGVQEFTADGAYRSPLNFYRLAYAADKLPEFPGYPGMVPPGKAVYILHGWFHQEFIKEHKLAVVYRGKRSQVVVAVAPDGPVPPLPITSTSLARSADCY